MFSEPRVLEGSFGGYPLPGVVNEDFAEEVQEELVEDCIWGNNVLLLVRSLGLWIRRLNLHLDASWP